MSFTKSSDALDLWPKVSASLTTEFQRTSEIAKRIECGIAKVSNALAWASERNLVRTEYRMDHRIYRRYPVYRKIECQ